MKDFEDIKLLAGRLFFPLLVLIGGIMITVAGFNSQGYNLESGYVQSSKYLIAGIVLILASIIFALYMLNVISTMLNYILSGVLLIVTIVLLVFNFNSLNDRINFEQEKEKRYADTKQRMIDIKEAQLAYKQKYGEFTESFDKLKDFVKNDHMINVIRSGSVPLRLLKRDEMDSLGFPKSDVLKQMNENLAWRLSKMWNPPIDLKTFVRDTVKVPVIEAIYQTDRYEKLRTINHAKLPFDVENMDKVPYAEDNHQFKMIIKDGDKMKISDPEPFDPLDPLVLGSLEEKKYNGNWSISR